MDGISIKEYEYYMKNRPHVVILGAGASCAAIPKGDKINSFAVCDDNNLITIYDFNYHKKDEIKL